MKWILHVLLAAVASVMLTAANPLKKGPYDFLKSGAALTGEGAEKLEEQLKGDPSNAEARIQLLSYYVNSGGPKDFGLLKAARARHILWLIDNDPVEGLGLFKISTGVYHLHCRGDELADEESLRRSSEIWLQQIEKHPKIGAIPAIAVNELGYCLPEIAEQMLVSAKDSAGLGRLYATAVLGALGES